MMCFAMRGNESGKRIVGCGDFLLLVEDTSLDLEILLLLERDTLVNRFICTGRRSCLELD